MRFSAMVTRMLERTSHDVVKVLLTAQDLADKFGISVTQVQTAIGSGDIPVIRIGVVSKKIIGRFGIDFEENEAYLTAGCKMVNENGLHLWQALRAVKVQQAANTEPGIDGNA
jgi:hypothetical protein